MKLNDLSPARGSRTSARRVGRGIGSGLGKTAGRGHKGAKARAGGGARAGFEGGQMPLQMRLPKFGFNSKKAAVTAEVRLSELEGLAGEVIDLDALKAANIIQRKMKRARVMASGSISTKVHLKGIRVTRGARAAIESAGGSVED